MALGLTHREIRILEFLAEDSGRVTRDVTVLIHGITNLRRHSALMYRDLCRLSQGGYIKMMNSQKPICWQRTAEGTAAVARRANEMRAK